jgi:hypothetical protein
VWVPFGRVFPVYDRSKYETHLPHVLSRIQLINTLIIYDEVTIPSRPGRDSCCNKLLQMYPERAYRASGGAIGGCHLGPIWFHQPSYSVLGQSNVGSPRKRVVLERRIPAASSSFVSRHKALISETPGDALIYRYNLQSAGRQRTRFSNGSYIDQRLRFSNFCESTSMESPTMVVAANAAAQPEE